MTFAHNRDNETWEYININGQFYFQQFPNCYYFCAFLYLHHMTYSPYINPVKPVRNARTITVNIDPLHSRPHIEKNMSVIIEVWVTTMTLWIRMWDSKISSVLIPIAYLHSHYSDKEKRKEVVKLQILETKLVNYLELRFDPKHPLTDL